MINMIIIDDEPNMFNELLDRLIKTSKVKNNVMLTNMDDCFGLCEYHIEIAKEMLKTKVMPLSFDDLVKPVYILTAIDKAYRENREVTLEEVMK